MFGMRMEIDNQNKILFKFLNQKYIYWSRIYGRKRFLLPVTYFTTNLV